MQTATATLFQQAHVGPAGYRDISPEAVHRARGSVRVVDVREKAELHATGTIPGAEHVPLSAIGAAAKKWKKKDEEIVMICRSGARSAIAAGELVRLGFSRVMNMTGGMLAYTAAGLPVARR